MSLLLPLALLGLLTVPVILLLHLMRNRREQQMISSLRLWHDLQQRRHGSLPRHLPLSFMLLLQLLLAVAITIALARPVSSFLLDQPERTIFILDMTTSMTAIDVPQSTTAERPPGNKPLRRFDVARQVVQDHIQGLDENDSVAVISLAPHPEILLVGNAEQTAASLLALDNLVPGAPGGNLAEALTLTSALVDPEQVNRIVVLTDGNFPPESQLLPSVLAPLSWQIIPQQRSDKSNQALFDVSSHQLPDGRSRIFARVVNYSSSPVDRSLKLTVDDVVISENTLKIDAQADAVKVWTVDAESVSATVEIVEPDILPLDNRADLLLIGTGQHRVLLVSKTADTLARAVEVQPGIELTVESENLDIDNPADFDLVIYDGLPAELTAWPQGNVLVINPSLGHPLLPADTFARNLRPDIDTVTDLVAEIELSGVFFNRAARLDLPAWAEVDLNSTASETQPAVPLIFHGNVENSRVMVWAFDVAASNLPARLALPLLIANSLTTLLTPAPPAAVPLGEPITLAANLNVEVPDGNRLFLEPGQTAEADSIFSHTKQPGIYKIYNQNNTLVASFTVHAGGPLESNLGQQFQLDLLAPLDASALAAPFAETAYDEFWPWLAGLALVLVTFEGWLAWRR